VCNGEGRRVFEDVMPTDCQMKEAGGGGGEGGGMQASEGGERVGLPVFALPRGVDVEVLVQMLKSTGYTDFHMVNVLRHSLSRICGR
jgi:hypothetical protein